MQTYQISILSHFTNLYLDFKFHSLVLHYHLDFNYPKMIYFQFSIFLDWLQVLGFHLHPFDI